MPTQVLTADIAVNETIFVFTRTGTVYNITRVARGYYYGRASAQEGDPNQFAARFTDVPPRIVDGQMYIGDLRTSTVLRSVKA